jgi:zinc transporter ZupT
VELSQSTWIAAIRLAVVISVVAGLGAIAASTAGDISQTVIVLSVIVIAFTASWIQTNRVRRGQSPSRLHSPVTR